MVCCTGQTKTGSQCGKGATPGKRTCWIHRSQEEEQEQANKKTTSPTVPPSPSSVTSPSPSRSSSESDAGSSSPSATLFRAPPSPPPPQTPLPSLHPPPATPPKPILTTGNDSAQPKSKTSEKDSNATFTAAGQDSQSAAAGTAGNLESGLALASTGSATPVPSRPPSTRRKEKLKAKKSLPEKLKNKKKLRKETITSTIVNEWIVDSESSDEHHDGGKDDDHSGDDDFDKNSVGSATDDEKDRNSTVISLPARKSTLLPWPFPTTPPPGFTASTAAEKQASSSFSFTLSPPTPESSAARAEAKEDAGSRGKIGGEIFGALGSASDAAGSPDMKLTGQFPTKKLTTPKVKNLGGQKGKEDDDVKEGEWIKALKQRAQWLEAQIEAIRLEMQQLGHESE